MIAGDEYTEGLTLTPGSVATRTGPARRPLPSNRRRAATRTPAWLRGADSCQRSQRRVGPIGLDLGVTGASVYSISNSSRATVAAAALLLVTGLALGVWKRRSSVQSQGIGWYLRRITPCVVVSVAALCLYPGLSARTAALVAATVMVWLSASKVALWVLVATARRRGLGLSRTLVIGPERQVGAVEYRIHLYPEAGLVCAHSHVCPPSRSGAPEESAALIERLLDDHSIEHVVCIGGETSSDSVLRDVVRLAPMAVDVSVVQQTRVVGASSTRIGDLAVICLSRPSWGSELVKRLIDIAAGSALLVLVAPVLLVTSAAIRLGDPGPALFLQRRTGRHNRMFTIFKFRSMVVDAERLKVGVMDLNVADGLLFKAVDDPRVTKVGAWIRRISVDELPQLINVVRGDMSLVGPRPLPNEFDPSDLFARARHSVLPGITGLWQVKGANALSYEDMIDLDCAYVASRSLGFDLRILLQTIPAVLVRRDPY